MTGLILWKDQEIDRLRKDIDRSFRRCCKDLRVSIAPVAADTLYPTDLAETDEALIFTATLTGIRPEDMNISLTENTLTIQAKSAGQTVDETAGRRRVTEQTQVFFQRIRLPRSVDAERIEAYFNDDVLKIIMPKTKQPRKARLTIQVR